MQELKPVAPGHAVEPCQRGEGLLTLKQELFVTKLFSVDCLMDPYKAVLAAGYRCKDKKSARNQAANLMKNPLVREVLETRLARMRKEGEYDHQDLKDNLWLEAQNMDKEGSGATGGSRVSATKALMVAEGIDKPKKGPGEEDKTVQPIVNIILTGKAKIKASDDGKTVEIKSGS